MMKKVFAYDVASDKDIERMMTEGEAIKLYKELSEKDGTFIGIYYDGDKFVQFAWETAGFWLMEIPQMEKDGALHKYVGYRECIELIRDIYKGADPNLTDGLHFESF
ncbi:hypothetical protein [Prevotella sp. KH2C16]|uniref:hypothetical protein n=1 Tax=Prevotella sp. KH2C16 TaxID=1855325 RepID=UPI0008EB8E3C|nr:hypothetical protein [Prevotella sp. KH2C16]SFG72307.1 hypothetical protein SAMN05216383_13316 [Prevotella sp. KH2C16]